MSVPTDERALVAACRKGDRRAQEAFYRRYAPPALSACRKYADSKEEALALLNGGMLKVFDQLGKFRFEGSLEGWVKRVVFRSAVDQVRSDRRRPVLAIADWDRPEEATATHSLYAEDLCRLIELLPEASREVFWLFAVEGYSHAEIAGKLGFTEGNSRWHLSKARQLLRQQLNQEPLKHNRYAG